MTTTYPEALEQLYARATRGIQPGLDRMGQALDALGHPERDLEFAHVAGTNGKGSTARMIAGGWDAALFTSPHLHSLTERFVVAGEPVAPDAVAEAWDAIVDPIADIPLTFFESVTLLAFELFRQLGVPRAVLEVGLGGRLDSTNVIDAPSVCAITAIGVDHAAMLGGDLATIAAEKAGILKADVPCVVAPQRPEVDAVLDRVAAEVGASLLRPSFTAEPFTVELGAHRWTGVAPRLEGAHQRENAAVAIGALWSLGIDEDAIARGLDVEWPGRLEQIGEVLLDAAHNADGARALAAFLKDRPPFTLVFGAMKDKDHEEMLAVLRPLALRVVVTSVDMERAQDPSALAREGDQLAASVQAALEYAERFGDPIVVTGSIFLVAQARAALLRIEGDPPIAM